MSQTGIFKDNHFLLLAPANARIPNVFSRVEENKQAHETWLKQAQQLRGRVYLEDGAITQDDLDNTGRHISRHDECSWHFLVLDAEEHLRGVMRCQFWYPQQKLPEISEMHLYPLLERMKQPTREQYQNSIKAFIAAQQTKNCFFEVAGLAVESSSQGITVGSMLGVSGYSIANLKDSGTAIAAATNRHNASRLFHKLGGFGFENLTPFFDSRYGCEMEFIGFNSLEPAPAIKEMITIVEEKLCAAQVYINR